MMQIRLHTSAAILITPLLLLVAVHSSPAQQTLCYPLTNNLSSQSMNALDLEPLPNLNGQTGNFLTVPVPQNLCSGGGTMQAWHFEDNAGLAFNNSNGFLGCGYTIEFLFKFDELPGLFDSPWLWIVGFQGGQDNGIFLEVNPLFGTFLEIWQGNTKLQMIPFSSFNTNDWYKFTLVRTCSGLVSVYVNCTLMTTFNDNTAQIFLPGSKAIFFQDDPAILTGEASPGKVRDMKFSNYSLTATEAAGNCSCLCDALNGCSVEFIQMLTTCDPAEVGTVSEVFQVSSLCGCACDSISTTITSLVGAADTTFLDFTTCDPDQAGVAVQYFQNIGGCDSVVVTTVQLSISDTTYLEVPTCEESSVGTITIDWTNAQGCDSTVVITTFYLEPDTLFQGILQACSGAAPVVFGNLANGPGFYCGDLSPDDCSIPCLEVVFNDTQWIQLDTMLAEGEVFEFAGVEVSDDASVCGFFENMAGCDSTVCYNVVFEPALSSGEAINDWGIYVPTAFSPNGDGVNDYFTR
ncbi:MAG: hypothetical protein H6577_19795 [Lewinellaceae bacterium]|nr:hypothetical protein [Lewinellaceae bacterium]